ncbi:MAG TPA: hypothetical protein VLR26_04025 [Frankiaceae bacterium]|nr:hypothetical protein [Frankiaceae bacterium]
MSTTPARGALAAVFSGDAPRALLDCPCHSSEQERWFRLRAEPMPESGKTIWAVLSPHVAEPEDPAAALAEWADTSGS